jgi:hypothetical protein
MNTGDDEEITLDQHKFVLSSWGEDPLMDDAKDDEDQTESASQSHLQRRPGINTLVTYIYSTFRPGVWETPQPSNSPNSTWFHAISLLLYLLLHHRDPWDVTGLDSVTNSVRFTLITF